MRWLLIWIAAFVVFNGMHHWLRRIGLGRVPGDFSVRLRGRDWHFPFGSSVLLTLIGLILAKWL